MAIALILTRYIASLVRWDMLLIIGKIIASAQNAGPSTLGRIMHSSILNMVEIAKGTPDFGAEKTIVKATTTREIVE